MLSNLIKFIIFCAGSLVLLNIGCSVNRTVTTNTDDSFVVFENAPAAAKLDGVIIPDQLFRVKLIKGWNKSMQEIGGSFIHEFDYAQNKKVIFVYFNGYLKSLKKDKQELNIDYHRFQTLCSENGIDVELEKIRIKHSRRFGMKVLNGGHFIAMYLNVPQRETEKYNYSINSLVLK
jgi:hypothetical protein